MLLIVVIVVHGLFLNAVTALFSRRFSRFTAATARLRVGMLISVTITLMVVTHFVETLTGALPIWKFGIIPNLRDAYFVVPEAYTTLGAGRIDRPPLSGPVGMLVR